MVWKEIHSISEIWLKLWKRKPLTQNHVTMSQFSEAYLIFTYGISYIYTMEVYKSYLSEANYCIYVKINLYP